MSQLLNLEFGRVIQIYCLSYKTLSLSPGSFRPWRLAVCALWPGGWALLQGLSIAHRASRENSMGWSYWRLRHSSESLLVKIQPSVIWSQCLWIQCGSWCIAHQPRGVKLKVSPLALRTGLNLHIAPGPEFYTSIPRMLREWVSTCYEWVLTWRGSRLGRVLWAVLVSAACSKWQT